MLVVMSIMQGREAEAGRGLGLSGKDGCRGLHGLESDFYAEKRLTVQ